MFEALLGASSTGLNEETEVLKDKAKKLSHSKGKLQTLQRADFFVKNSMENACNFSICSKTLHFFSAGNKDLTVLIVWVRSEF